MAFSNNMTALLNKVERKLGLRVLEPHLAKIGLGKSTWVEPIREDSITSFSRFFPNQIRYEVTNTTPRDKDGYYYIDEELIEGKTIIGVRDLDYKSLSTDSLMHIQNTGYGFINYQALQAGIGLEDIAEAQMGADISSLFNQGIYIDFIPPNKFKLSTSTNKNIALSIPHFHVVLLINHDDTLLTISPTMMEIFEELVYCDVANYLYQNLKYYDGLDTIYANIDLKLDELTKWADHRPEVIDTLDDAHTSSSNPACPIMVTLY